MVRNIEDKIYWERKGKKIAVRNLFVSVLSLIVAFMAWMVWSQYVVYLKTIRSDFNSNQLYWLTAFPLLSAGILRILYSFAIPKFGGKSFTLFSTAIIVLPMTLLLWTNYGNHLSYEYYAFTSILTGLPGANFASSSANISYFFPHRLKGIALGINASIGNMGVGIIQLIIPWLITLKMGGILNFQLNSSFDLQAVPLFIIFCTLFCCILIYLFMNNLDIKKVQNKKGQSILNDKHNWIMCILYTTTFGSFIGFAAVFPMLLVTQFKLTEYAQIGFIGALLSSLMRPIGHILSKKIGSVITTQLTFILMSIGVVASMYFLPDTKDEGSLYGFVGSFLFLFLGTGIGKGSTTAMIPDIFSIIYKKNKSTFKNKHDDLENYQISLNKTASCLGFTSAIATIGAFFIPNIISYSESYFFNINAAMYFFILSYVLSFLVTFYFYQSKNENNVFYFKDSDMNILLDTPDKQDHYLNTFIIQTEREAS